jgi:hypothetical protein
LRYLLGHLSDDEYRTYTSQAGRILAELNGDEVGAASMLDGTLPVRDDTAAARRTPAARENQSATSQDVDRCAGLRHPPRFSVERDAAAGYRYRSSLMDLVEASEYHRRTLERLNRSE